MSTNSKTGLIAAAAGLVGAGVATAAMIISGPAEKKDKQADFVAAINAGNAAFMRFFKEKNAKAIAELYAPDARLMATGVETMIGREKIAAFLQQVMAGVDELALETDEVLPGGDDKAIERGRVAMKSKDGKILDQSKYVVIWKLISGKWYLYIDIFNSSVAPKSG